jgi:hypothetical protein
MAAEPNDVVLVQLDDAKDGCVQDIDLVLNVVALPHAELVCV